MREELNKINMGLAKEKEGKKKPLKNASYAKAS